MWWRPERFLCKKTLLEQRAALIRAVRGYFDGLDFCAVETPSLQVAPGMEPHIHAFHTELLTPDGRGRAVRYLHTSPEFAMKKLLVAGMPRIYQICHVFRNAEGSRLHSPEFTMIEWYRAGAGYRDIMDDCEGLLRAVARALGVASFRHAGKVADPFAAWERVSVCEAFEKYAGFSLEPFLPEGEETRRALSEKLAALGFHTHPEDRWDDLFFRVFLEKIEPALGLGQPTILYDYPVSMAALARAKPEDARFAERFEVYVCGVELANAFGELTDPEIQRARFVADMDLKEKLYGERWPVDEDFIAALRCGMPECAGIALGIDRLAMLATGAERIDDILWCGVDQAEADRPI